MLPGSVGTCEMFFKQIASLSSTFRIISVSYPAEPDPVKLADGLAVLMDSLALKTASILGSSFGGYWAQFLALRHPERVDRLLLGNIFIAPDELFANPLFAPELVRASTALSLQAMWHERVVKAADSELKRIQIDMLSGRQSPDNLKARLLGVVDAKPCPSLLLPNERIVVIDCSDDPSFCRQCDRKCTLATRVPKSIRCRTVGTTPTFSIRKLITMLFADGSAHFDRKAEVSYNK